jgi:kinesin family protein 11
MAAQTSGIQVVCRLRPLSQKELKDGAMPVVSAARERKEISVVKGVDKQIIRQPFTFDHVFDTSATQADVFDVTLAPVITDVMAGYESTVFAYGQTGTGKTHTMEGEIRSEMQMGVIPRAAHAIFDRLSADGILASVVRVSYLEIYNEELCDLLADESKVSRLMIAEDNVRNGRGVYCHGLSEWPVGSPEDMLEVLQVRP